MLQDDSNKLKARDFLKLLTKSQNAIFSYILTLVPNKLNAEDVYQDTVSTLWEKFDSYQAGTNFEVWACVIAKYKTLHYIRKNMNSKILFTGDAIELLDSTLGEFIDHFDERTDALKRCLKKQTPHNRRVLKMRYENGWPVKKIAAVFEQSVQGVYKQLNRIHITLMTCIEGILNS